MDLIQAADEFFGGQAKRNPPPDIDDFIAAIDGSGIPWSEYSLDEIERLFDYLEIYEEEDRAELHEAIASWM
jgi:hypothetical protein